MAELGDSDGRSMREEVDALASRAADGTVAILLWRHTDDQYQTSGTDTVVDVRVHHLDAPAVRLRHCRIDAEHSNAYTRWTALGSPQDPTAEELTAITDREGLEEFEPPQSLPTVAGALTVRVALPLPAVSLLILQPVQADPPITTVRDG